MTTPEVHWDARKRVKRLRFDGYSLDLNRGCLLLRENEIALRPKTFAVLRYLTQNSARLVPKDELFNAVWPGLAVTDDTLVQSVGELRRALGDDGPRLIKTVPRRGYRFEAEVSFDDDHGSSTPDATPSSGGVATSLSGEVTVTSSPVSDAVASTPQAMFLGTRVGRRVQVIALVSLLALLFLGALWSGVGSERKVLTHAGRPANKIVEFSTKPAIAILPFLNQSDDAAREYFADGLTQDIINVLGRFSELTVMSWNAVLPFKGQRSSPTQIASRLAVRYQVEGSVRQTDRLRVSAQLVDTDGRILWSARFDEALVDVFALQDKIATQIAGALAIQVTQVEQRLAFARPTENLEAYDFVLRARSALQRPARASNVEARALLKHAIQLDPGYSAAYAALAETWHIDVSMGWAESPADVLARAEDMANKALSINASDVRAHIILGRIHMFHQRYEQAMAELERAIAINPNDAHGLAGRGNTLMWMGRTDAAIESLEAAQRIDPEMNAIDRFALGLAYYLKRRYDASIEQAELNVRNTTGANFSRDVLAAAYAQTNRPEEAARVVAVIHRLDPAFDARTFGSKFLNPADLEHLRDGFRKAGLYVTEAGPSRLETDR